MVRLTVALSILLILQVSARRNRTITRLAPYRIANKAEVSKSPPPPHAFSTKPPLWDAFTKNGTRLYRRWQDKKGPDIAFPRYFRQYFNIEVDDEGYIDSELDDELKNAGLSADKSQYKELIYRWPNNGWAFGPCDNPEPDPEPEQATFRCSVNGQDGIFLAQFLKRGDLPSDIKFSSVAFYMWVTTYQAAHPPPPGTVPDYSKLSSFWMVDIANDDTASLLDYIVHDLPYGEYLFHPYGIEPETDNPFWALLGSVNGRPIIYMLTDFKRKMKGKGISGIWIGYYKNNSPGAPPRFSMWADIE